ncbi:MAG TPA: alanine racemase [Pyrinomonadaceae bacterium]|jgi:alanine racemase|nr:alanine racemase [Pyrinomonadaceae bacterium]
MNASSTAEFSNNHRPTWAEIDLDALANNFKIVRESVGSDISVMAVVKADAYGHGAVECARRLAAEGAEWFGVATPEEGVELREAGITQPILCLGGFWPGQEAVCINHQLVPVIYRLDMLASLNQAAIAAGVTADIHIKIDTGMGRLGVRFDQLEEIAAHLSDFKNLRLDGLMTHFAAADDHSCEPLTHNQVERFDSAVALFREQGFNPEHLHLSNSAGIFDHSEARGTMVRPGGVLYGMWRDVLDQTHKHELKLHPVMSVRSRICLLKWVPPGETIGYGCTFEVSRPTLVATLPLGYHDGYMRGLSNRGRVIVRGVYASVIGRVSMDLTLVDVTNISGVIVGDVVTLLGTDSGLTITAEDLARISGTISYELTCGISERVPRVYC